MATAPRRLCPVWTAIATICLSAWTRIESLWVCAGTPAPPPPASVPDPQWEKIYSEEYQQHYWANVQTGETTWTEPVIAPPSDTTFLLVPNLNWQH